MKRNRRWVTTRIPRRRKIIGFPDPDPGAKSSSNPVLFGAVKRSGNPFFQDLLDLYMDVERILERFVSKKFLWLRIGKTGSKSFSGPGTEWWSEAPQIGDLGNL